MSAQAKPQDELIPDSDTLIQFVNTIFKNARPDGFISFRVFEDNSRSEKPVLIQAVRLDDHEFFPLMTIRAAAAANWFRPAVFSPPVCTFKNALNAKTDNIHEGVEISAECDQAPRAAREKLEALLGPATIVVESGGEWENPETGEIENKVHLHWRLKRPVSTVLGFAVLYEARALATQLVGGDNTNKSIVHPLRWPGSWHRKKTPKLARITALNADVEIDVEDALEKLRKATGTTEPIRPHGYDGSGQRIAVDQSVVASALAMIPNDSNLRDAKGIFIHDWNYWNTVGMTIWASTDGSEEGRLLFHEWSAKAKKYNQAETEERWKHYFTSPPTKLSFGSLVYRAREADPNWRYENPMNEGLTESVGALIAQMIRERDEPDDASPENEIAADEAWDPWRETLAPRLDHSLLPRVVREAAATSARVSGADIDAFAIGYLVGLTACGDTRLRITPKQHARDWSVPMVLWVLLVAPPSSMKSEVVKAARALAGSLDMQERERYRREVTAAEFGAIMGLTKLGKTEAKKPTKKKTTKTEAKRAREEAAQTVPPPRQRVCGDITTEKLVEILGANPGGCAVIREELSGWLGALGRYSSTSKDGADRAFYCAMRDGSPHDYQRKTSASVHLDSAAGSFFSAVQPDRALEMELPMADGLMQRFLPLIMREARGYEDSDSTDDAKVLLRPVRDRLAALVPNMHSDPYGQSVAVPHKLTSEGAKLYQAFANDMRLAARTPDPSKEFGECLNKMGPMWLSFALLFHLIESEGNEPPECVPFEIARRVDTLVREFFIPHAEQFYDLLTGGGSVHKVRSVATAILHCPSDVIVLRDVVHRCRVLRSKDRNEQIQLMQKFETFGWLTRLDRFGVSHPRWRRTSGLSERFAEELKREEAARAAMTEAIKANASAKRKA